MKKIAGIIAIVLTICISKTSLAQFSWGDIKRTVGDVASTGLRVVTAPTQTVINAGQAVLGNQSGSQILQPWRDVGNSAGNAIQGGVQLATAPNNFIYQKAREFAQRTGTAGTFIFDVGTFTSQFYFQFGAAGAQAAAQVLKGQNPLVIVASPLAAAIRAAREAHYANSRPLPERVKQLLSGVFSSTVLNRARYAIGNVEITLPNFIGKGVKYQEDHYAVTVDDIIVFKTEPGIDGYISWWAHEIRHTEQYLQWGVEVFAYNYIKDLGAGVEQDAEAYEGRVGNTGTQARFASISANAERFVAQCFFPQDPYPVSYMVTNQSRIIAVNPVDGSWMHVGYAAPPVFQGTAWSYQTPMMRYSVTPQGGIFVDRPIYDNFGRLIGNNPFQVGHVITF